ncbi:LOW QUALITY PROTEIN: heterogeneous nuclear ribonucleoprotein C-like [Pterocles gutturalis]
MALLSGGDTGWRYLDVAREPKPSRARLGPKRQHGSSLYPSNCELDYDLYRDELPYWVYEYQKIPPLINHIPVKARQTHAGARGKSRLSPQPAARSSPSSPAGRTKPIKGELSQIKAQVDSLLESLDHMDQQRERLAGFKESEKKRGQTGAESPSPAGEGSQEPRKEGTGAGGHSDLCNMDSAEESTDIEDTTWE